MKQAYILSTSKTSNPFEGKTFGVGTDDNGKDPDSWRGVALFPTVQFAMRASDSDPTTEYLIFTVTLEFSPLCPLPTIRR
jgi:hypothetical protein